MIWRFLRRLGCLVGWHQEPIESNMGEIFRFRCSGCHEVLSEGRRID